MRLDYDCIRDILLCVEENTALRKYCCFIDSGLEESMKQIGEKAIPLPDYQEPLTDKYGNDKLIYHVQYCLSSDLLVGLSGFTGYQIGISDLSPSGHELIGKIRDGDHWIKTKLLLSAAGAGGLKIVSAASEGIASAMIGRLLKEPGSPPV